MLTADQAALINSYHINGVTREVNSILHRVFSTAMCGSRYMEALSTCPTDTVPKLKNLGYKVVVDKTKLCISW